MSTQQITESSVQQSQSMTVDLSVESTVTELGYYELEQVSVRAIDQLAQLKLNVDRLEELSSRFAFLNREIRYIMKV